MLAKDSRPGAILALALLANAPIFVGFVLAPLFTGGNAIAARAYIPAVLWTSAPLGLACLALFLLTPKMRREHRAARIGLLLALVALLLWALVLALTLRRP